MIGAISNAVNDESVGSRGGDAPIVNYLNSEIGVTWCRYSLRYLPVVPNRGPRWTPRTQPWVVRDSGNRALYRPTRESW